MSDRELLELAAKAAGLPPGNDVGQYAWDPQQECLICIGVSIRSDTPWNPLEDDGDALRLAVKLGLDVFSRPAQWAECGRVGCAGSREKYGDNPYAATRLAIVRAAAEIGKAMP